VTITCTLRRDQKNVLSPTAYQAKRTTIAANEKRNEDVSSLATNVLTQDLKDYRAIYEFLLLKKLKKKKLNF